MKHLPCIFIAVTGLFLSIPLQAYERLQGPTEVLFWNKTNTYNGYTFFGVRSNTYLIDMEGRVAHTWPVGTNPHLLTNGNVLDATGGDANGFTGLTEVDWSGNTVWQYTETRTNYAPHHDFLRIYNPKLGTNTTLYIAAKSVTSNACVAAGCNPANAPYTNVTVDAIVEVDTTGTVVWEWCFFDHGIQDYSAAQSNYVGSSKTISNYPGRINLNLPGRPLTNDWLHCNAIDYNTNLDQIVITAAGGEFYVIDHGNTFLAGNPAASIALAASANGDFLYRFGDPARYSQGSPPSITANWTVSTTGNKQIGASSDAQWIPAGVPGAGHFLVYNNGGDLFETTPQSYIFEINGYLNASTNDTGAYVNPPSAGYYIWSPPGHDTDKQKKNMSRQITWMYYSMANQGMFSHLDSGIQRLPNGNTLICDSTEGHIFEVTSSGTNGGTVVWEYINPVTANGIITYKRDNWPTYNYVFRAYRYATNHPALAGRTLLAQSTITSNTPSYISAPTITGTTITPSAPAATNSVWVTSIITNSRVVTSATLTYIAGNTTNTVVMLDDGLHQDGAAGDGIYGAQIPAFPAGTNVSYYVSAQDDFGNTATDTLRAYTVQAGPTNLPPVIANVTQLPATPTSAAPVTISAVVTDDLAVASVVLTYSIGTGSAVTNTVFTETMATNAVKPWTGTGCDNAWTVTYSGSNPFQQQTTYNYGTGNPCALQFGKGTTNLSDSMITTTNGIDARGNSGTVTFYLQTSLVSSNVGWAMQLNSGSGFTTRLSGQTTSNQNWQLYSYSLQSSDLVSNLFLRFQFSEGIASTSNRIFLDQITVSVVSGGSTSSNISMSLGSSSVYTGQILAQPAGTTVFYYLTAWDSYGLTTNASGFSYLVLDATNVPAANFTATPTSGAAPLTVTFTDSSTGSITNRFWDFGDGTTTNTTVTSLIHTYAVAGTNAVTLVATGPSGVSTNTHLNCINVIQTYTLTYAAGLDGTISGTTLQTVVAGGSGASVTAVPNTGYHFVMWSDGGTANPRTDVNVTNNITVTANFAINMYTLTYTARTNGTISGTSPQTINYGGSGTAVTAVPDTGYAFVNWSDSSTDNPRTDTNVIASINVTARFTPTPPVANFTAMPASGGAPLLVTFTDASTGFITNRFWSFGDGFTTNTTVTNVLHTYSFPGTNTVQLIVSGPLGLSTNTQTSLIIATSVDTVGDGIPDWWRAQFFGGTGSTTNSQSCAACDPDGDGMSNLQEYLADTNPTNSASFLALVGLSLQTNGMAISWIGGIGATQVIESSYELPAPGGAWFALFTNLPPTAITNTFIQTGGLTSSNQFYRIKAWR